MKILVFLTFLLFSNSLFATTQETEDGIVVIEKRGKITATILVKPSQTYINKAQRIYELTIEHSGTNPDENNVYELPRGTTTIITVSLKIKKIDGTLDTKVSLNAKKVKVEITRGIIEPVPMKETDDKGKAQFVYTAPNETVRVKLTFSVENRASKSVEFLLI